MIKLYAENIDSRKNFFISYAQVLKFTIPWMIKKGYDSVMFNLKAFLLL